MSAELVVLLISFGVLGIATWLVVANKHSGSDNRNHEQQQRDARNEHSSPQLRTQRDIESDRIESRGLSDDCEPEEVEEQRAENRRHLLEPNVAQESRDYQRGNDLGKHGS